MDAPSLEQLETLKYSELQRLAKAVGLKANLKAGKLLKVLKQHFQNPVLEHENMVDKIDSSTCIDAEELDSSQIPVSLSLVTKRHRKQKRGDVQENLEGKNADREESELSPPKEILTEQKESEGSKDAGSGKTVNQNECLANNGATESMTENSATIHQKRERDSTRQKRDCVVVDPVSGKKPQYTASVSKSSGTRGKSTTPNFKKLHEAQFKKMQSIDDYIERKNKMIKNFSESANEVKMLAKKRECLKISPKETRNSNSKTRSSFRRVLSPHPQRNSLSAIFTPVNLRRASHKSQGTTNKSILSRKSAFNSISLSTTKMNVRFSESTKDNEHKRSLTKTPSRKSPFLNTCTPDGQMSNTPVIRKNFEGDATKCQLAETSMKSAVTPFKFVAQTAELPSTKKPIFDLQASLSKPLHYQPHRGKLKPWGELKENIPRMCSHKGNFKQQPLQTREKRRERHEQERKQKKDQVLETYRGLIIT